MPKRERVVFDFVGRAELLEAINEMTAVHQSSNSGDARPVLVVEGCGGSGRSALLAEVRERLHAQAPTVLVHPPTITPPPRAAPAAASAGVDSSVRRLLAAIMLGLSEKVAGYDLKFERVLLAHIAINAGIDGTMDAERAKIQLREATNNYRDPGLLQGLIGNLAQSVGALASNLPAPGGVITPALIQTIADQMVKRFQTSRWFTQLKWSQEALLWFGERSQGLHLDPEAARVRLCLQASSSDRAVRRDVDELLVAALLADLRHSLKTTRNRPLNVLVLIDEGDGPAATTFIRALLRTRQAIATRNSTDRRIADPLTVVTASNGTLGTHLTASFGAPSRTGTWHRMPVGNLHLHEVVQLARDDDSWSPRTTAAAVGASTYRLTRGHAATTAFVLNALHEEERLAEHLDTLLRRSSPSRASRRTSSSCPDSSKGSSRPNRTPPSRSSH
ncbi:hypothetical protein WEH80_21595 [Actinomycetes bacterium KLBMP 9759]